MLKTFFLQKGYLEDCKPNDSHLDVHKYYFTNNIFQNFKTVLEYAYENKEDIIYCISGGNYNKYFEFDSLETSLLELAEQEIFTLYVDVVSTSFVPFNQQFILVPDIVEVNSFIVMRPAFKSILAYLELIDEFPDLSWVDFLSKIIPNNFLLNRNIGYLAINNYFHVISPFRNVKKYITGCLESILKQEYKNFEITFIDDNSDDDSSALIQSLPFIRTVINPTRKFALQNTLDALMKYSDIDDETIICIVDGDDKLANNYVFDILNSIYQESTMLFTYGSMSYMDNSAKIGSTYTEDEYNCLRKSSWKVAHLRTFKYKLFKKLLEIDPNLNCLRDENGEILRMPADMALLFPLMELAGFKNTKFINTNLYRYRVHQNNDQYLHSQEQYDGEQKVRNKPSFAPVF